MAISLIKKTKLVPNVDPRHRAWVEVNPDAIEANTKVVKNVLFKSCLLMAVVKADGYGHGAFTVAKAVLRGGAQSLGVATLQEGIDLRQSGIECPILVLGNLTNPEELGACIDWDLMPTLSGSKESSLCNQLAKQKNVKVRVHLKVDTGMTRLGCELNEAPALIHEIDNLSSLDLQGIYSHLALADGDLDETSAQVTAMQKQKFDNLISQLAKRSRSLCKHLANSAGTFLDDQLHYDMVRVGLALYGYSPINQERKDVELQPAISVKARITFVRDVAPGTGLSYGHKFITKVPMRIAVVGIGYADGVARSLSGKISVLVKGQFCPQVGSITMDQLLIDITNFPNIHVGEIVTLIGSDGKKAITASDWSRVIGSIPWEILCSFKYRLPRVLI